jgi:hypothetical protein
MTARHANRGQPDLIGCTPHDRQFTNCPDPARGPRRAAETGYSLNATPLKVVTPIAGEVAAGVRSP